MNILLLACTREQARSRPRWVRWIIRHQVALLMPIFALEFFSMHRQSLNYVFRRRSGCARAELWLLVGHYALYGTVLIVALGVNGGLAFAPAHHALTGLYMATIFAPNHKGMPLASPSRAAGGFLREQVLTARNNYGNWLIDLVYGGLHYQIEHHLFPSMPRNNLRRARPIVRSIAKAGVSLTARPACCSHGERSWLISAKSAARWRRECAQPRSATWHAKRADEIGGIPCTTRV